MKKIVLLLLPFCFACERINKQIDGTIFGVHPWSSECEYKLPSGCKLVTFGDGKYGVSYYTGGVFQWSHRYIEVHIESPDTNGSEDDRYSDSCDAKGMVKYYFTQIDKNKFK